MKARITAEISLFEAMDALRKLEDCSDERNLWPEWSIWQAEILRRIAKKIEDHAIRFKEK